MFGCQYRFLLHPPRSYTSHRLGFTYYHGKPGIGIPEFDRLYEAFCSRKDTISRVQVSHSEMRDIVLESGIDATKVFLIPIGINLSLFPVQTPESKSSARAHLGIPATAMVIGSFQKDGNGWGAGMEPKHIKGPDVLLDTIKLLGDAIPDLFVLLSGPARGFVKAGLERLRILSSYEELWRLYHALDLYLVTSRVEGGPKGVLESMAAGIPLVTTRVGQAMDIVKSGVNGWITDVEDSEGLAHWAVHALSDSGDRARVIECARQTAEEHSYEAQRPLWKEFMHGFVKIEGFG
jgi:glycosyltransferase involved in cell wall biosynthesis